VADGGGLSVQVSKIAHISDLHFDKAEKNKETWSSLVNHLKEVIQSELILVTGDIVDTPKTRLYRKAQSALEELCRGVKPAARYFVCPGNHDRHPRGNAPFLAKNRGLRRLIGLPIRAWLKKNASEFNRIFDGRIARLDPPDDISVGNLGNRWNLRILGIDSSINADASARGFIGRDDIAKITAVGSISEQIQMVSYLRSDAFVGVVGKRLIQ
jgi:hypothetical protein